MSNVVLKGTYSGVRSLTSKELIEVIASTDIGYDSNIRKMSVCEVAATYGITKLKALKIHAAIEIGRRSKIEDVPTPKSICSSRDSYRVLLPYMDGLTHEEFYVIFMNRKNHIIQTINISKGGTAGTIVDPKIIFRKALALGASSMILSHNHPSQKVKPSQADIRITKKLVDGAKLLDIVVLDHVIVSDSAYYSFADEGMI